MEQISDFEALTMIDQKDLQIFKNARPTLLGLAYRILGSSTEAEDAVQDTYLKWQEADKDIIHNPPSWLTTVCTRRCIDLLQAAHKTRVNYVGTWLPEPVHTLTDDTPEDKAILASSLTTAFLLLLERLTPKERAAYLLYEIFDFTYAEISQTLNIQESACRKLVSRAKANIDQTKVRHTTPLERQDQLLAAFQAAITEGVTASLTILLSDDIRLSADGGGKVPTILKVLQGKAEVISFLTKGLNKFWGSYHWHLVDINGARGIIIKDADATVATVSFAYDEAGKASNIYIVRSPDKLAHLDAGTIH